MFADRLWIPPVVGKLGIEVSDPYTATGASIGFVPFATPSRRFGATGSFFPQHQPCTWRRELFERERIFFSGKSRALPTFFACVRANSSDSVDTAIQQAPILGGAFGSSTRVCEDLDVVVVSFL